MMKVAILAFLFIHGQAARLPRPQDWFALLSSDMQAVRLKLEAGPKIGRTPSVRSSKKEEDSAKEDGASQPVGRQLNSSFCRKTMQAHPNEINCPDSCPYLRHEATGNCLFKCVRRELCKNDDPLNSFADDERMQCMSCRAKACEQCSSDAYTCSRCHGSYELVGGECKYKYRALWFVLYAVILTLFLIITYYVVELAMRPNINHEVAEHALRFRTWSKVYEEATGKPHSLIKTDLRRMYVNGVGTMLHFQWQSAVIWWSILVLISLGCVAIKYWHLPGSAPENREEMFEVCNAHVQEQAIYFYELEHAYFYVVFVIYIFTTVGCLSFAFWQKRWANRRNANLTTMQDYVLIASGFPQQPGSEPAEEELREFFEEMLVPTGAKIVGVSVCWDSKDSEVSVADLALKETDKAELIWEAEQGLVQSRVMMEMRRRSRRSTLEEIASMPASRGGSCLSPEMSAMGSESGVPSTYLEEPRITAIFSRSPSMKEQKRLCDCRCTHLDSALCGTDLRDVEPDAVDEVLRNQNELQRVLDKSVTSGSCYVVLNTEKERDDVYDYCQRNPIRYPIGVPQWCQNKITVKSVGELEPEVVCWSNYGIPDRQVKWNMLKGVGVLILVIAVLDVCFYFPYMSYVLKMQEVRGMSQGHFSQGFLLGLLITVCNQIIYAMALLIADACGFNTKDEHTKFYVTAYTAAVSINTFVDLWAVSLLARGYVVDHGEFVDDDAGMSMKALADNYALQMSLYQQIWAYIFPGTLLAPYLCEPVVVSIIFRLRLWIVRSRKISVQLAEELLQCPPFDLARYGDILIIAILCSAMCLFTYRDLWTIYGCAVISLIWIYFLDKFRLLRFTSRATFVNQQMSDLAHLLSAFPCAVLSACVIFRAYASQSGDNFMRMYYEAHDKTYHLAVNPLRRAQSEVVDRFLTRDTVVMVMITAGILHLTVHWIVLTWVVPYFGQIDVENDKEVPYSKCAEEHPCNWFNANPMFCLRSKYYYRHGVPCTQFKPGKEHILQVNHSIGQYFQGKDKREPSAEAAPNNFRQACQEIRHDLMDEIKQMRSKRAVKGAA